jgi:hypothetical protein
MTNIDVTDNRGSLGGVSSRRSQYAGSRAGFNPSGAANRAAHEFGGDGRNLAAFCPRLGP